MKYRHWFSTVNASPNLKPYMDIATASSISLQSGGHHVFITFLKL